MKHHLRCSVLQCCCSVVAVRCSALNQVSPVLQCVAVLLQRVELNTAAQVMLCCCSVLLQCVAVCWVMSRSKKDITRMNESCHKRAPPTPNCRADFIKNYVD